MHRPGSATCVQMTRRTPFSYPESVIFPVAGTAEASGGLGGSSRITRPVNVVGNGSRLFKTEATVQLQPLPEGTREKLG